MISALAIGLPATARAEDAVITVKAVLEPATLGVGEQGKLTVDIQIPSTFHLWSLDPGPGPAALTLALPAEGPLTFEGPWHGPEPLRKHDRGFGRELGMYEGAVRLERAVRLVRAQNPGEAPALGVRGQICTDDVCVGQRVDVKLELTTAAAPTGASAPKLAGVPLDLRAAMKVDGPTEPAVAAIPAVVEASVSGVGAGLERAKAEGVLSFLFLAFLAGLGALVTPCVFPAIPLTVSFFSKYSEEGFGRGARLAAVYAATMVATFTVAGVLISVFFGVTGVQDFASHPVFNLVLALTLVFFAMNLLGWFEIGVPGFVLTFVNKLESSYGRNAILGDEGAKRSGATDYVVVVVAAITATTVFFTCTVAFVGIVLVAAAKGEWFWPTIGMLAFSSAFALPFFLLAMFPQAAHRLRGKSGSWLTATRVTLGFLELAAAMKFLSNADLVWQLGLVTRDLVLALWIPLFALAGLFLLGKLKLGEDVTGGAEEHPSVPRVLVSTMMFGLSIYLAAGLFNGRPFGGWIDGWLPPVVYPGKAAPVMAGGAGAPAGHAFAWVTDLAAGRARASREQKLVFVNYTGYTCTNCRYMEGAVFPLPEIAGLLNGMVLVELYTDGGTPEQDRNRDDQVNRFNTAALPLYSVERADGTVLGTFASSTNDPAEFRRFLDDAIAKAKRDPPRVAADAKPEGAADPGKAAPPLVLRAQRLTDGVAASAIEPGRWTLINFWATWCGPCVEELKAFLVERGRTFENDGGRFVTVAFDEASDLPKAKALMAELGVAAPNALYVVPDAPDAVDPRFGFDGATLPYTVLVSPTGEVVWKHRAMLSEKELDTKLVCFAGAKRGETTLPSDPKKCTGSSGR